MRPHISLRLAALVMAAACGGAAGQQGEQGQAPGAKSAPSLAIPQGDATQLKPSGWGGEEATYSGAWTFTSPDEKSEAHVHFNDVATAAELAETAKKHMQPYGTDGLKIDGPAPSTDGVWMSAGGYMHEDTGERYLAASAVFPHKLGGHLICYTHAPLVGTTPPTSIEQFLEACGTFASSGIPYDATQATTARNRASIASVPVKAGKGRAVEALLLDEFYFSGYGGMVLPDYSPIVLFKDGTACACLDLPLADIDPAELIKTRPDDVTRWQKSGGTYVLTWPDDTEPTEIKADMERPQAYAKGATLDGYWQRIGGGGNIAMGGDVGVMTSSGYRFFKDGTFSTSNTAGATAPGVATGSTREGGGRYDIGADGLLMLTHADGRVERTSLFHGNGADPVLWIGGDSFVM